MDYWKECIAEALEDAGIIATDEQIDTITSWVDGAHENYGLATGQECIPNPLESEVEQLNRQHEKELQEKDKIVNIYRQSVATRRRVNIRDVYTDNGEVYYS